MDLEILQEIVTSMGHTVIPSSRIADARRILNHERDVDVIVTDMRLPDGRGIDLLDESGHKPIIVVTAHAEVADAVEAMRGGAFHYLIKPIRAEELQILIERAASANETARELTTLKEIHGKASVETEMVIRSAQMREIFETAQAAANSDATILILGESGTGKEVLARAIHRLSPRSTKAFVAVNCGAIPASLLEADLFGHERGAFTGAVARRIGKFERAHKGTLFLDEIGTLPVELQVRLLRAIQEREIERVGGSSPIKVDFRLIAATNADLTKAVKEGQFREDLFYRINVIPISIPPLRERPEEIPALIAHFLEKKKAVRTVSPAAMQCLAAYHWPGNIRELENAVERALVLSKEGEIHVHHLPEPIRRTGAAPGALQSPVPAYDEMVSADEFLSLDEIKRRHIELGITVAKGRREEAARLLGIHRNTLRGLMKRYGMPAEV